MSDRPKTWDEVTDDEIVEAVRVCAERDREHVARGSSHVGTMLSAPTPEQWPTQPCPANAATGLGLIPRFGEGSAHSASVTARLKRLVKAGRLEEVPMLAPRGKPTSPGYRLPAGDGA
jgi:hypothetical protein